MEEISKILNEFLKEDMSTIEKTLAAALKDIDTALHIIGAGLAPEPPREYSIIKVNYFYDKVGEDIEE